MIKFLNTKIVLASILATSIFAGCVVNQDVNKAEVKSNKTKVVELLQSMENGDKKPASYINKNKYIQHNLGIKDGLEGFGEVLAMLPKGSIKARVLRAFQDGPFVFTHTDYNFFGPKVGFDIFRFENGKIVEHWDNLQEKIAKTVSGRTQLDGATKITDLDKTEANKTLVKNFIDDILFGKNPNKITEYISTENYHQHNTAIKDGLSGLGNAIKYLVSKNDMFTYEKVHKILGEGNFVLSTSEVQWHGKAHSFYDLFRIENGKIVEHWDTIEEIPSQDKWQNTNGKF
ncbi:nuclear transport factor 2 family protein [Poseidonibacter antarcticus]|uniref:nuclear transport factor 2 family protein n=1 Tax=Poseidonibacter antarcticus TaxID=2478538 RepID=UPI000EF51795|nr:hypothetical protein [Poseidonibacter antarcticus]